MKTKTPNGLREDAVSQVATAPELQGAPHVRGPSAFARFCARPEVRVWAAPALRGLTLLLGLSTVAVLGHAADRAGRAGIPLEDAAGKAAVSLVSPSTNVAPAAQDRSAPAEPPASGTRGPVPNSERPAGPMQSPCANAPTAPRPSAVLADGRIVLNEASIEDFMRLPGVGQKRAESMLALREKMGGFKKVSDLTRVKGIGYKSVKKFEGLAVVTRPREEAAAAPAAQGTASAPGAKPGVASKVPAP